MGLVKSFAGAVGGVLADSWKEFFYCEALPENVLAVKGQKRVSGRSSNTKGEENIISDGSVVAVADGQCLIIVEQGKVVDVCAEPGEYIFDGKGEPTIFAGQFLASLKSAWERFKFGGIPGKDTRVYYFNTKEIIGNKYGTPNPVPFRVVDQNIGLDMDISLRCSGEYSFRLVNPILFYVNVCGNFSDVYTRDKLESQMKAELLTALQPAFAKISEMGIRYSAVPAHTMELANALNDVLSSKWRDLRGIEIVSFGVTTLKANEEDEKIIRDLQKDAVNRDPSMAAARLTSAQADAMKIAAANSAGAMTGFMGMGMAQQSGGFNAADLYNAGSRPAQTQYGVASGGGFSQSAGLAPEKPASPAVSADTWTCECGHVNSGKFCPECGKPKPAGAAYKCDKCGWVPPEGSKPPKFCPECGDPFNEGDKA